MRYKCTVMYDGTLFHGFQSQKNLRTVQQEIEDVLVIITKKKTIIYPSGRTDTGVHAIGQVFHFDCDIEMGEWNVANALNSRLPKDIFVSKVEKVEDTFHARFSVTKKEYHYLIDFSTFNPLHRNYRYYCRYQNVDIKKMLDAKEVLIGEHDFKSFTKNKTIRNTTRHMYSIDFEIEGSLLKIKMVGNGFLHNMVRILVAMLLECGRGKYSKDELKTIMEQKNRIFAPKIITPAGLYLFQVYYD